MPRIIHEAPKTTMFAGVEVLQTTRFKLIDWFGDCVIEVPAKNGSLLVSGVEEDARKFNKERVIGFLKANQASKAEVQIITSKCW